MYSSLVNDIGHKLTKQQRRRNSTYSYFIQNTVNKKTRSRRQIYKSSAVAEMGDRGHNRHGPKTGGLLCPFHGELRPCLIQCGLGRGLLPYQVASSSIQPFGHKRHEWKTGGLLWGAATPPNTTSPEPTFTSVPSGILIHPTIWPQ